MIDPTIFIVVAIVACETIAMTCIKKFNLTKNNNYLIFAIVAYAMVCLLLNKTLNYDDIAKVNVLWSGLSVLASTILGVILFKEELHIHDYVAIILITIGVVILKLTK